MPEAQARADTFEKKRRPLGRAINRNHIRATCQTYYAGHGYWRECAPCAVDVSERAGACSLSLSLIATRVRRTHSRQQQKKDRLSKKSAFVPRIGLEAQCHRHKLARIPLKKKRRPLGRAINRNHIRATCKTYYAGHKFRLWRNCVAIG